MSVRVLGVHTGHNATAALLCDGVIVACVSEERFTRTKNDSGIPTQSIASVLAMGGISGPDLDMVAIATRWRAGIFDPHAIQRPTIRTLRTAYEMVGAIRWRVERTVPPFRMVGRAVEQLALRAIGGARTRRERIALAELLRVPPRLSTVFDHHACHAAAAYHGSPYGCGDAVVCTIDGEGDGLSATVNVVRGGRWNRIAATSSDASLGWLYREVTGFLGMRRDEHEYKVMGLAPYAKSDAVDALAEQLGRVLVLDPGHPLRFRSRFDMHHVGRFLRVALREERFDTIAGACQRLLEDRITAWITAAVHATGIHTVCIGGGVAMNVKANLAIAELPDVERLWPCPSAGDESTAIGAAYLGYLARCHELGMDPHPQSLQTLYLGTAVEDGDVEAVLQERSAFDRYIVTTPSDIEETVAEHLAAGHIVARCVGRMEWGARALGNRSILADPRRPEVVRVINEQIKSRDFWMPFAPSILAERATRYLVNPKDIPGSFMAMAFHSTPLAREHLRAAMHPYDFTIRPQILDETINPDYHRLISAFERRTGVGAVLNTSFNLHGEPIVSCPRDALDVFERSGLRFLALGRHLIAKR
ncbi:MAG: carbamoyltransferase C-terminal domain-containing protein [bacterium]|nr:carbamoyltransferase C-terminal domain-containing protein [bacterium]